MVIKKDTTKENLVEFLHASYSGPITQTWTKAVDNNHFTTWPGLSTELIKKHLSPTMSTAKFHLCQEYQRTRSTKSSTKNPTNDDAFPSSHVPNIKQMN